MYLSIHLNSMTIIKLSIATKNCCFISFFSHFTHKILCITCVLNLLVLNAHQEGNLWNKKGLCSELDFFLNLFILSQAACPTSLCSLPHRLYFAFKSFFQLVEIVLKAACLVKSLNQATKPTKIKFKICN